MVTGQVLAVPRLSLCGTAIDVSPLTFLYLVSSGPSAAPASVGPRQRSRANPLRLSVLGVKQLPVPLRNDFDGAVGHFYGGLIVNRVRRYWYPDGQSF